MNFFSGSRRPMHLGKYPMEKITRVDTTTTLITDDVQRVPKRANFFLRGDFGDFGEKHKFERTRFIRKVPLADAMRDMHQVQIPLHKGEPAKQVAPLTGDPAEMARHIKSTCYFLDADIVGICEMPKWAWYSHDLDGTPIETKHKYAIVLLIDQGWDTLEGSSGNDWISGSESYRAYLKGSTIACTVANYIRQLGYPAQAHSNADGDVLQVPLVLLAGLGELSRIGEVVLNPFLGPRFKTAVITTDLPLEVDKPIDFGLQDFCTKCKKCARECPVQAIPFGDKVLYNGYEIWKPDVGRCVGFRVKNPGGSACGRCMKMCPFNKEGIMVHRLALWVAIKFPSTRRLLTWLDDALKYGRRNPIKKWWFDLETVGGRVVKAQRTNDQPLQISKKIPTDNAGMAMYPPEVLPRPDQRGPVPIDRVQGQRAREQGERDLVELKSHSI